MILVLMTVGSTALTRRAFGPGWTARLIRMLLLHTLTPLTRETYLAESVGGDGRAAKVQRMSTLYIPCRKSEWEEYVSMYYYTLRPQLHSPTATAALPPTSTTQEKSMLPGRHA